MILKKSSPYAVLVALMAFNNRIDGVMLDRILRDNGKESGVYAQAFRLLDATNMVAFLTAGLLLPMFSRMLKYKEAIEPLVKTSYTVLITLAIVVAGGSFFYGQDIMKMLYNSDLDESPFIFKVLMCCFLGTATQYVFSTLLTANGNLKELNIIAASGMVMNIVLNFIIIPRLHAKGSAMVSLTSNLAVTIAQVIMVHRIFKFHTLSKLFITLLIFTAGVLLIGYFSTTLKYSWIISFGTMIVVCGIWAWVIGLANIKSLIRVMKYE
jgi:O-antigen/teichoic acid export membrane protein